MKVLLHNEAMRQPLVIEIGENDAGIPLFDARHEAEAFLFATVLGSDWEAVELPDGEAADVLESFGDPVGAPGHEDEYDKAISWVILNPPPVRAKREVRTSGRTSWRSWSTRGRCGPKATRSRVTAAAVSSTAATTGGA